MTEHAIAAIGRLRSPLAMLVALLLAIAAPAAAQQSEPMPPKCENGSCQDPLFTVYYPPNQTVTLESGITVHLPAHYYDADLYQIAGTADLRALQRLTAGSGFQPLRTSDGKGVANVMIANYTDTNIDPYREWFLQIPVNSEQRTIADSPYELFAAVIDPDNAGFVPKLALDRQLDIDIGREYYGLDKEPQEQGLNAAITTSTADLLGTNPLGQPFMKAHLLIDDSPAAQADTWEKLGSTAGFQRWAADTAKHEGFSEFNFVYRSVVDGTIRRAHVAGRITTTPEQVRQGAFLPGSSMTAYPTNDWGRKLQGMRFEPRFVSLLPNGRYALDRNWGPDIEPGSVGGSPAGDLGELLQLQGR